MTKPRFSLLQWLLSPDFVLLAFSCVLVYVTAAGLYWWPL